MPCMCMLAALRAHMHARRLDTVVWCLIDTTSPYSASKLAEAPKSTVAKGGTAERDAPAHAVIMDGN